MILDLWVVEWRADGKVHRRVCEGVEEARCYVRAARSRAIPISSWQL